MLPKHCEHICILDVDFICAGFMNKHDTCAKFQLKVIKNVLFYFLFSFCFDFLFMFVAVRLAGKKYMYMQCE